MTFEENKNKRLLKTLLKDTAENKKRYHKHLITEAYIVHRRDGVCRIQSVEPMVDRGQFSTTKKYTIVHRSIKTGVGALVDITEDLLLKGLKTMKDIERDNPEYLI